MPDRFIDDGNGLLFVSYAEDRLVVLIECLANGRRSIHYYSIGIAPHHIMIDGLNFWHKDCLEEDLDPKMDRFHRFWSTCSKVSEVSIKINQALVNCTEQDPLLINLSNDKLRAAILFMDTVSGFSQSSILTESIGFPKGLEEHAVEMLFSQVLNETYPKTQKSPSECLIS